MSTQNGILSSMEPVATPRIRVYGLIDGFNLYHALDRFEPAMSASDPDRYQKYKWLCLTSLLSRFVAPKSEILSGVHYFTAYPNWHNTEAKRQRHERYVSAQKQMGVQVTLGEFKPKATKCRAKCGYPFQTYVEKQTDINIAVAMIELADSYDKVILLTGDSDQVPSVHLLKRLHPSKTVAVLPPIGRPAKALIKACDERFTMTEEHLANSQLPNPMVVIDKSGKATKSFLVKPTTWS